MYFAEVKNQCKWLNTDHLINNKLGVKSINDEVNRSKNLDIILKTCFNIANELFNLRSYSREEIRAVLIRLQDVLNAVGRKLDFDGKTSNQNCPNDNEMKKLYNLACGVLCFRQAMVESERDPLSIERYIKAQQYFSVVINIQKDSNDKKNQKNEIDWLACLFYAKCLRENNKNQYHYLVEYCDNNDDYNHFCEIFLHVIIDQEWGVHIALDALINMGRCWKNRCLFEKAEQYYRAALWVLCNKNESLVEAKAWHDNEREYYNNRLENLKKMIKSSNNFDSTSGIFDQVLFRNHVLQAQINLLICYIEKSDDFQAAEDLYNAINDQDKNNIDAKNNFGRLRYKQGKYDDAITQFEELIAQTASSDYFLPRTHRFAMLEKAKCHIKLHQFNQAEAIFSLLQANYPKDYELQVWKAIWHRNQKQLQPAVDLLQKICNVKLPIRRGTIALKAYFVIGTCYLEWNKPEQAYQYFETIRNAVEDDVAAAKNLGWCCQLLGEYEEAIDVYEKVQNIILLSDKNKIGQFKGDNKEIPLNARENYDLVSTYNNLGQCYICLSQYNKALEQFFQVLNREPFNSMALCCAAHCLRFLACNGKEDNLDIIQKATIDTQWNNYWKSSDSFTKSISDNVNGSDKTGLFNLAIDLAQLARQYSNFDGDTSSEYMLCLLAALKYHAQYHTKQDTSAIINALHGCLQNNMYPSAYCLEALGELSEFVEKANKANKDYTNIEWLTDYSNYRFLRSLPQEPCYEQVTALINSQEYKDLLEENQGKLLINVYLLHYTMEKIKNKLRIGLNNDEHLQQYRHYTSMASLKALLVTNSEKPARFRLSNVASMNDSAEGRPFFDLLCHKKCQETGNVESKAMVDCTKTEDDIDVKNMIQKMDLQIGNQSDTLGLRNVYITSLCSVQDYIYMWAIYADKGAGCNLLFGKHFFDVKQHPVPNFIPYFFGETCYPLYEIQYIAEDQPKVDCCLAVLLDELRNILCNINQLVSNCTENMGIAICQRITNMLDQVRYLFKYNEYSSEQEVRCIVVTASHKIDESKEGIPRLYTEIDKDIYFDEVCLGPKAIQIPETEAWLYSTGRVSKVTRSKRHYR